MTVVDWHPIAFLTNQCLWCKHKVKTRTESACEHRQRWFPHAQKCAWYEPEDLDE